MDGWRYPSLDDRSLMGRRDGDQWLLDLVGGTAELRIPWGGRSPRALTRVSLSFIFKPQGEKSMSEFVDPEQCDLFAQTERGPRFYTGAAPLLPLPGGHHG